MREWKSAYFSAAISLKIYGEQNCYLSNERKATMGFCFGVWLGNELKNITSLKIRSKLQPLTQIGPSSWLAGIELLTFGASYALPMAYPLRETDSLC